jgi:hypothetical protein
MNAGDQGTIAAMQYCTSPTKVKKGDTMELSANYDLDLHPPRMQHGGGMVSHIISLCTKMKQSKMLIVCV